MGHWSVLQVGTGRINLAEGNSKCAKSRGPVNREKSKPGLHKGTVDANNVEKNPDRIDVYVNGQLMASGTSKDYLLGPVATSLSFYFGLEADDVITVRTY